MIATRILRSRRCGRSRVRHPPCSRSVMRPYVRWSGGAWSSCRWLPYVLLSPGGAERPSDDDDPLQEGDRWGERDGGARRDEERERAGDGPRRETDEEDDEPRFAP